MLPLNINECSVTLWRSKNAACHAIQNIAGLLVKVWLRSTAMCEINMVTLDVEKSSSVGCWCLAPEFSHHEDIKNTT